MTTSPSARDLTRVGLTLLATWLVAQSITLVVTDLTFTVLDRPLSETWLSNFLFHAGSSVASLLLGIGLFLFRGWISEHLSPAVSLSTSITASEIEAFAVALLGLYMGMSAVIGLVKIEVEAALITVLGRAPLASDTWPLRIADMIQLAIGVGLALRAPGLVALWHRLRTAGHNRTGLARGVPAERPQRSE